jgi:hypothetical protein
MSTCSIYNGLQARYTVDSLIILYSALIVGRLCHMATIRAGVVTFQKYLSKKWKYWL